MNHGLDSKTTARIQTVLSKFPQVEKAILYGSRAKGNHQAGSDIDLTLLGPELDQRVISRIADELDDLLLPYRFDLSIFAAVTHGDLIDHIQRVGVTFYEKAVAAKPH